MKQSGSLERTCSAPHRYCPAWQLPRRCLQYPVKKDQPLFQFDRRPYQYKVDQIAAQYLPSDDIPKFQQPPPTVSQGQYGGENTCRSPRSVQVYNRRAGFGCNLHKRRARRMGCAAQNLHSRTFLV